MLHRPITFQDFDGNTVTENFYFNLSKSELLELEVAYDGGLSAALQRIIDASDVRALIAEMKKLVLLSYGKKSEDGKRFVKSDQLREEFTQTPAYDALFMELATNDGAAAVFIQGIVPKDLADAINSAERPSIVTAAAEQLATPSLPPPPSV